MRELGRGENQMLIPSRETLCLVLAHGSGQWILWTILWKWKWKLLIHVWLFATTWTIQSMKFSRPFPSPGDLPNSGVEPRSPALQVDCLPAEPHGKPNNTVPSAANLSDSRIELGSPTLQVDSLPTELSGKPELSYDEVPIFVFEDSICRPYFLFLPNFKNINTEVLKHKNLKALKK